MRIDYDLQANCWNRRTTDWGLDYKLLLLDEIFEKEQEEALKQVVVGDTITFEGTCLSAGAWTDCEIVG